MTKKTKKIKSVEANEHHYDLLGREMAPGHIVAYCERNRMIIGRIERLTGKMIRVKPITDRSRFDGYLKYPSDTVILHGEDVMMHVLKTGL